MSVLSNFSVDANFWDLNPLMRVPKLFAEFYNNDTSKKKEESSRIMWAIAMYIDTSDNNPYRNLRDTDRKIIIAEDYLKDAEFVWDNYSEIIKFYQELNSTKLQKDLFLLESKLEERSQFILDTKYTLEDGDKLDKIIANTQKIYDLIKTLKDNIEKGENESATRGGRTESASEQGRL